MYKLYTNNQPWLDKDEKELEFETSEIAHRYAERVDKRFYLNYAIDVGVTGLFIQGQEHTPPVYIIKKI